MKPEARVRRVLGALALACSLLLPVADGAAQAVGLAIDSGAERIDLSDDLSMLVDPGGSLGITEAAARADEFRRVRRKELVRNFDAGVFWLRVVLENPSSRDLTRWLVVGNPRLQQAESFLRAGAGWQVSRSGRIVPAVAKPVIAPDAVFPVDLAPGQVIEVFLRVTPVGATDMATALWVPEAYRLDVGGRHLRIALTIGGVLLGAVLAFFVFGVLRQMPYFWFGLALLGAAGLESARENLLAIYLWPPTLGFFPQMLVLFAATALLSLAMLLRSFLDLGRRMPNADWLVVAIIGGLGAVVATSLFDYGVGVRLLAIVVVVLFPTSLLLSLLAWRQGFRPARYLAFAFSACWIVETARQLANLGVLPLPAAMNFTVAGALLFSTPLILLGLVERTQELSRQLAMSQFLNRAKSDFLARVSHDLRSPLGTIIGFARMLRRGSSRLSLADGAAGIETSGLRLLGLIDALLDESRLIAGRLDLAPEPLAFPRWLDEVCHAAALDALASGNRFSCERRGGLPDAVLLDGVRLRQVIDNLLSNANRHTHGGEIHLVCEAQAAADGDEVTLRFSVADTGEGIRPDDMEKIFEPFVRGEAAQGGGQRQRSGFGLGLSIARELVRLMNGDIAVRSRPGEGSRFSFAMRFPVLSADAVVTEPAAADSDLPDGAVAAGTLPMNVVEQRPGLPAGAGFRVLLVDDDPQHLQLVGAYLQESGFGVGVAGSGEAAAALIASTRWDAIITDQMMAAGDGWTVLRRAREACPATPVVLLSAVAPQRPADVPPEMQFDFVLRKGTALDSLLDSLPPLIESAAIATVAALGRQAMEQLAVLADEGDVSGIEDWLAACPQSPPAVATFARWATRALRRLDLAALQSRVGQALAAVAGEGIHPPA